MTQAHFTEETIQLAAPGRGRWKIGVGILAIAVVAQAALWTYFADDRTGSKMSILFVWPAALFALAIWWTFFSAQPWRIRLAAWGLLGLASAAFYGIFAVEGTDGEMTPTFRLRWRPSAKAQAAAYLATRPAPKPADPTPEVLASQEPWLAGEGDWPGFRGPNRDGVVAGVTLRRDWDKRPLKELWRHPVGLGWSSFAVVGDLAFTQEQRGENECVVCYRVDDGSEVWVHADPVILKIVELNGDDGPHATPQFHEGRLYTLGGTGVLNCLDARTGSCLWQTDILKDAGGEGEAVKNIQWGMSGSPLIVDDLVIVSPGGQNKRSTIAYDRLSGEIVWSAGNYEAGYASPHLATIHGVRQVIVFHGTGIAGHDLSDGRQLWNFDWVNNPKVNSVQPLVFDDGSVLFGCSYGVGTARVDLVRNADGSWEQPKLRWKTNKFRPKFNDFVIRDGFVYGLDDGILLCLDPETGKVKWKDRAGQYGYGQMLLAAELLLILSEQGELVLVEARPDKFQEVARMQVLDPICWNHIATAHGKVLVRNNHVAACFELD
jgi:outer membrane protein assembly factor BamB